MWFWSARVTMPLVVVVIAGFGGRLSQVGACLITRRFARRIRVDSNPGQVSAAMLR